MNTSELEQALNQLRSRGEIKRFGLWLDTQPDVCHLLCRMLEQRGVTLEPDLRGKQLVKRWLNRDQAAQRRSNPIHRDEAFLCAYCEAEVSAGGEMIRDHCPFCLSSQHLDIVPGDRAANCGGQLVPINLDYRNQQWWVYYECALCSHTHRVRAHPDDQIERFSRR